MIWIKFRDLFHDGLVIAGAGLVTWGLWSWWPPAGFIGLGAMLITAGIRLAAHGGTNEPSKSPE